VYLSPQNMRKDASEQLIQIFITAIRYFSGRGNMSDSKTAHNNTSGRNVIQKKVDRTPNQNL
jgi:hypothetical protein